MASKSDVKEPVDDTAALRRARLTELYQEAHEAPDKSSVESASDTDEEKSVFQAFYNPEEIRARVTGFNVRPEIPTSINEAIETETVDEIQFELDNDRTTRWYAWKPSAENALLTRIVEHYGNGDISNLYGAEVDITRVPSSRKFTITYPTPYDKHTSHLSYKLWRRASAAQHAARVSFTSACIEQGHSDKYGILNLSFRDDTLSPKGVLSVLVAYIGVAASLILAATTAISLTTMLSRLFMIHFILGPILGVRSPIEWYVPVMVPASLPLMWISKRIIHFAGRLNHR